MQKNSNILSHIATKSQEFFLFGKFSNHISTWILKGGICTSFLTPFPPPTNGLQIWLINCQNLFWGKGGRGGLPTVFENKKSIREDAWGIKIERPRTWQALRIGQ
jgi:hypothetical protein